jgi:hypothetical protein
MSAPPAVVVIDDGELETVAALLEELGSDFERCTPARARERLPCPEKLLVTPARSRTRCTSSAR